jgi:hypothetical protein
MRVVLTAGSGGTCGFGCLVVWNCTCSFDETRALRQSRPLRLRIEDWEREQQETRAAEGFLGMLVDSELDL